MATDKDEKGAWLVVRGIILLVVGLFTYYGFFNQQPCDIDAIYLSCRLNPFTAFDLIGCVLFYAGSLVLMGVPKLFGIEPFNPTGSSLWNIVTFVGMAIGLVLIWNL